MRIFCLIAISILCVATLLFDIFRRSYAYDNHQHKLENVINHIRMWMCAAPVFLLFMYLPLIGTKNIDIYGRVVPSMGALIDNGSPYAFNVLVDVNGSHVYFWVMFVCEIFNAINIWVRKLVYYRPECVFSVISYGVTIAAFLYNFVVFFMLINEPLFPIFPLIASIYYLIPVLLGIYSLPRDFEVIN